MSIEQNRMVEALGIDFETTTKGKKLDVWSAATEYNMNALWSMVVRN